MSETAPCPEHGPPTGIDRVLCEATALAEDLPPPAPLGHEGEPAAAVAAAHRAVETAQRAQWVAALRYIHARISQPDYTELYAGSVADWADQIAAGALTPWDDTPAARQDGAPEPDGRWTCGCGDEFGPEDAADGDVPPWCAMCRKAGRHEPAERPDLDVIEARANAATPEPWHSTGLDEHPGDEGWWVNGGGPPGSASERAVAACPTYSRHAAQDAEFIAAARADIPTLLAYARQLERVALTADDIKYTNGRLIERAHAAETLAEDSCRSMCEAQRQRDEARSVAEAHVELYQQAERQVDEARAEVARLREIIRTNPEMRLSWVPTDRLADYRATARRDGAAAALRWAGDRLTCPCANDLSDWADQFAAGSITIPTDTTEETAP